MDRALERLEASLVLLECLGKIKKCKNSHAAERARNILREFVENDREERLEDAIKIAEKIDEVLKEGGCCEDIKGEEKPQHVLTLLMFR